MECPICSRPYKTERGLINHLTQKHPDYEPDTSSEEEEIHYFERPVTLEPVLEPTKEIEEVSPSGDAGQGTGKPPFEPSPAPDIHPLEAALNLAHQNSQMLNMLIGTSDTPGWMQSIEGQLKKLTSQISTTREPGGGGVMQELNKDENKWVRDLAKTVIDVGSKWVTGSGNDANDAFLAYLGEDAKKTIMEKVRLDIEASKAFIKASNRGEIQYNVE